MVRCEMPVFAITFRIKDDSTYQSRYESVVESIRKSSNGSNYWLETTSFALLESAKESAASLASYIDSDSTFSETKDLLVVINLSKNGYKILGNYSDKDIDKIMKER